MKQSQAMTAVLLSVGLTIAACGPGTTDRRDDGIGTIGTTDQELDRRADTTTPGQPPLTAAQQGMPMTITGCVAEENNQMVLTQLEPAPGAERPAGVASFQLVGDIAELRQHVGQRVRVMGEMLHQTAQTPGAATGDQADARDTTAPGADRSPIGTTGEPGRADAEPLRVSSITPVEGACPSPGNR